MRIVAGKYKSRLIEMPKGVKIRPTKDMVREAVFNVLGTLCIDSRVLDLYSGSGAIGIEALSRGAAEVSFVDNNQRCVETIRKNLNNLGIEDNINIYRADVFTSIRQFGKTGDFFSLIFMDPPYYGDMIEKTLITINKYGIIHNSGVIISEHFKKDEAPKTVGSLQLVRQNSYGNTIVSFYKPNLEGG
ncbi:MAG: 16S rRNA (guanine(966)-N(2))-methyltransferase RsmD [Candidatus Omnitrophica bacterium CG07_land_8_20_14_0_80_42_15]|uniref:16S rRNA (Guanine(966)-N(2))-methyltransferase RsmD n=1 Tax=Candidatus Aquitaenariimonas noxiae TaxID=1974741 RepID=A0A2J0KU01_9BACT|nr:MAG: 16S rRNA (guanine(966)-N(2))-methyltransferase RsmD [Candidatus Omnitrophica bacterium CG07_land_8_20_14_0_80_42_15]